MVYKKVWVKEMHQTILFCRIVQLDSMLLTPANVSLFIDTGVDFSPKMHHGYDFFVKITTYSSIHRGAQFCGNFQGCNSGCSSCLIPIYLCNVRCGFSESEVLYGIEIFQTVFSDT